MNTTKMYQILKENEFHFKEEINGIAVHEVYMELLDMVTDELFKESEKAAGRRVNIRNVVKRFISADPTRESLHKAQIFERDGKTYYAYLDGFRMAWSPVDYEFGTADVPINVNAILNPRFRRPGTVKIDPVDLKMWIKTHSKSERAPYRIEVPEADYLDGNYILLNPYFLQDAIDFTGSTELELNLDSPNGPIILNGIEDRHALVLPIRK